MKLIFVAIMLAVNQYGQASVPFIIPSVTISSEQCASQPAVDTIMKSLKENLTDQIIKNHFTMMHVKAVTVTILGLVWLT